MAWNECMKLTGGPLRFDRDSMLADQLNRREFTAEWAEERNCVVVADLVRNDVYGRIDRSLRRIASKADFLRYRPDRSVAIRPQDIVAYAYLQADLEFPTPFEKLDGELVFQGTPVSAFGIGPEPKVGQSHIYPQVWVHDYAGRDDFIVELHSKSKDDRLIMARVRPGETLLETIETVQKRLVPVPAVADIGRLTQEEKAAVLDHLAHSGDVLMVPKMAFEVSRTFSELLGLRLRPARQDLAKDLLLLQMNQLIRFEMDEKGASLRSVAQMSFSCAAVGRQTDRWMVFDGPFLVMLQRKGAPLPYFAAWVANSELLRK